MRLIDADALEALIKEKFEKHYGSCVYQFIHDFLRFVIKRIEKAPTIEAEPVRHGKWIDGKKHADFVEATCTACNGILLVKWYSKLSEYRYCPNCGAKMDKEKEYDKS